MAKVIYCKQTWNDHYECVQDRVRLIRFKGIPRAINDLYVLEVYHADRDDETTALFGMDREEAIAETVRTAARVFPDPAPAPDPEQNLIDAIGAFVGNDA